MGRDLAGGGEIVTLSGSLLRNATVSVENLSIIETGKIGGNLDYYMEKTATASIDTKNVKGNIVKHEIQTQDKSVSQNTAKTSAKTGMFVSVVFGILSFSLLGAVLIFLDKKGVESRVGIIISKPLQSGIVGFVSLIIFPFFLFLVMITMIGLPLAFVGLFIYITALITASLYTSIVYGKLFFDKIYQKPGTSSVLEMIVGVIFLGLVVCLPIIGWIISFVSFCLGLGAILISFYPAKK